MKQISLWISIIFFITACSDEEVFIPTGQGKKTRSLTAEISPMFNWQDTAYISLFNVPGKVTLPWYSGATSNIPDYILNDYKAEDGWKMVYNTCSSSNTVQDDKYYLIFYNIFSGRLRGYIYNKNNVTSSNDTFWQISFNNNTTLLNDIELYTLAGDTITNNREMMVSALTNTPTKALTRGWNVFDADFLMYDPNVINKNITMALSAYDVNTSQISLTGDVELSSSGTMITITKIPVSSGSSNILSGAISALGDFAEKKFLNFFDSKNFFHDKDLDTLSAKSSGSIIKAGGNWLVNKFFGRKSSTQTITSNSDIKISTEGTIQTKGTITSHQQSNISPISHLMLPGSTPTPEDIFLPSYNEPLGVWHLKYPPTIVCESFEWFHNFVEIRPGPKVTGVHSIRTLHTLADITEAVLITPAVSQYIEKYEATAKIMIIDNKATKKHSTRNTVKVPSIFIKGGNGSITYTPLDIQNYYFSSNDSLLILANSETSNTIIGEILNFREDVIDAQEYIDLTTYKNPLEKSFPIELLNKNGVVKVTVTLYPKSPFNTAPIVTTRTFKPRFISRSNGN